MYYKTKLKRTSDAVLPPLLTICALIAVWEGFVRLMQVPLYVLPAPSDIAEAFLSELPALFSHSAVTLYETLIGLLIAGVSGVLLAVLMDNNKWLRKAIYPILVVSQTVPVIVLAPIFIIYLGFGLASKTLVVVLMCFFPIVISFADGMSEVDERLVSLVRAYGAKKPFIYLSVKIPAAAVSLFSGLKVAATYSVSGAVVGEWLSSAAGLGYYMLRAKNGYMLDKVFASVLAVVILSLMMNGAVRLLKYLALPHLRGR